MRLRVWMALVGCLVGASPTFPQAVISFGGEGTELSLQGVLSGTGADSADGNGARIAGNFRIEYLSVPGGHLRYKYVNNPWFYTFELNVPEGLPDYQSRGIYQDYWDSRGRNGDGDYPWINEEYRGGIYYNHHYRPTGGQSPFGLVEASPQWALNYYFGPEDNRFRHTYLAGTVEDWRTRGDGDVTALLRPFNSIYVGWSEDGQAGPGLVEYQGSGFQGMDADHEIGGVLRRPSYLLSWDADTRTGTLTPSGFRIVRYDSTGWVQGYYDTLSSAVLSAAPGDLLVLSRGTYQGVVNFGGRSLTVASRFIWTGDPEDIATTVIDADSAGTAVLFTTGETEAARLIGLTITGGVADDGGGVLIRRTSPTISDCVIRDNYAVNYGGGAYIDGGAPVFRNCRFTGNRTGRAGGGGLHAQASRARLEACEFRDNQARWGGGLSIRNGSDLTMQRCVVAGNQALHSAGVYVYTESVVHLEQSTVAVNVAETQAGGISLGQQGQAALHNSIVWGNRPTQVEFGAAGAPNNLAVSYSLTQGGRGGVVVNGNGEVEWGGGNLDADPRFVNPAQGDYGLQAGSPCIDAGDPESLPDPDGTRTDIGAVWFRQRQIVAVPYDFPNIQTALNSGSDTVVVMPGVYRENLNSPERGRVLASLFIFSRDQRHIEQTVIDGGGRDRVLTFTTNPERREQPWEVTGFTIRNGRADRGGGAAGWVYLHDMIVEQNLAAESGGGIAADGGTIYDVLIRDNRAPVGGGIAFSRPEYRLYLDQVTLTGNLAEDRGAGIYFGEGVALAKRLTLYANSAPAGKGGGIFADTNSDVVLDRITFHRNAADSGGAVFGYGCRLAVVNSIGWDDQPQEVCADLSTLIVAYSDLDGGREAVVFLNDDRVESRLHWLDGNIAADPQWVDAAAADYHLSSSSPCVDAGSELVVWEGDTLTVVPREEYVSDHPDMGALESEYSSFPGEVSLPTAFALHPLKPNPFNGAAEITFDLSESGPVRLAAYDLAGREIAVIWDGRLIAGRHQALWRAERLPSGLYLVRLWTAGASATIKAVLMK